MQTVSDIKERLSKATAEEFAVLERSLCADTRKGVQNALAVTKRRLAAQQLERQRVDQLYSYQRQIANGALVVGLDEVGRGPLAGPLTVGAVVLREEAPHIEGLNDSKQVPESHRPALAEEVKKCALAWAIVNIEPAEIDECGMTACLRKAFRQAIAEIEAQGVKPEVVLLDGNHILLEKYKNRPSGVWKDDVAFIQYCMGKLYLRQNKKSEAEECFRTASKQRPLSVPSS